MIAFNIMKRFFGLCQPIRIARVTMPTTEKAIADFFHLILTIYFVNTALVNLVKWLDSNEMVMRPLLFSFRKIKI